MSTSPKNGDGVLPSPSGSKLGPSAGRRGHAHRRSAAISCHDLSFMLKMPTPTPESLRAGSAPSSPSEANRPSSSFPRSIDTAVSNAAERTDGDATDSGKSSPGKTFNKSKVGFSDTLEYIPRPVSMVASDTSSIATVRQGHSVSGSLSSIVSSGTQSPSTREFCSFVNTSSSTTDSPARPKTAGAILSMDSPHPEMPELPHRKSAPTNGSGSPMTPKFPRSKYLFFSQDGSSGEKSPAKSPARSELSLRTSSINESACTPPVSSPYASSMDSTIALHKVPSTASRRSSVSRGSTKKQKRVRSWAGSILGRKSRSRCQKPPPKSRRSPTPPSRTYTPVFGEGQHASQPISSITEEPTGPQVTVATDFANWKPRHVTVQDDDTMSPIIDLDAALGPFNTPSHDPVWEASQKGSGPTKRRMHSALKMSAFSGPGMHYHRRAESAPEMAAFDFPRSSIHRLGSSSTMADVFEEDEEDDWEDTRSVSNRDVKGDADSEDEVSLNTGIQVVDAEGMQSGKVMNWSVDDKLSARSLNRKTSGLSEESANQGGSSMKSERSNISLREDTIMEEPANAVEIADDQYPPTPGSDAKASDSTLTPPLRPMAAKELAPVSTLGPIFLAPSYGTPTSPRSSDRSPLPSPRSPMSYDTQRISTAPSSVTDDHSFASLLGGEPGPEVRMSVDDVPSLTSSESTTTSGQTFANMFARNGQFRDGQRSASLSSAAVGRKRNSIASLSRLISSSHGEKSKLSIDSRPPGTPDSAGKSSKHSRGKRLSRMMQFWKPRDASP